MDDFTTRTYGTSGLDNRPLFGETSARVGGPSKPDLLFLLNEKMEMLLRLILPPSSRQDRIINLAVGGFTSVVVLVSTDFNTSVLLSHCWGFRAEHPAQPGPAARNQQLLTALTSAIINKKVFGSAPVYTSIWSHGVQQRQSQV